MLRLNKNKNVLTEPVKVSDLKLIKLLEEVLESNISDNLKATDNDEKISLRHYKILLYDLRATKKAN